MRNPSRLKEFLAKKYIIPGEVGKELYEAYDAYRAQLPNPAREVALRYHRIKGSVLYLRETLKLTNAQIADVKLDDLPSRRTRKEFEQSGKGRTNFSRRATTPPPEKRRPPFA